MAAARALSGTLPPFPSLPCRCRAGARFQRPPRFSNPLLRSLLSHLPQNISYKDKAVRLESKGDLLEVKEAAAAESEVEALKEVRTAGGTWCSDP